MTKEDLEIMAKVHEKAARDLVSICLHSRENGGVERPRILNALADQEEALARAFRNLAKEQE